jgi:hypothetical protein
MEPRDRFVAVVEDSPEIATHQRKRDLAEPSEMMKRVINAVAHDRPAAVSLELVTVAPEAVGPVDLAVHEGAARLPVLDARAPTQGDSMQLQPVVDYGARSHLDRLWGDHLEAEPMRGDPLQVPGLGEEREHLLEVSVQPLLTLKVMHFHGCASCIDNARSLADNRLLANSPRIVELSMKLPVTKHLNNALRKSPQAYSSCRPRNDGPATGHVGGGTVAPACMRRRERALRC